MSKQSFLSSEAQELYDLLRLLVSEERFAYDYTRKWRFLCATPQEHAKLCRFLGVDLPAKVIPEELAEMDAREIDAGKKPRKRRKKQPALAS